MTNEEYMRSVTRACECEFGRTQAGSVVLRLCATPHSRLHGPRRLAAFVYQLAAQIELASDALRASWCISPDPSNAQIVIELGSDNDFEAARRMVQDVLEAQGLG